MPDASFVLLYVADPARSVAFYSGLLERKPVEQSPTFAMLEMAPGVMLGLWKKEGVAPEVTAPGGAEVAFPVADANAVEAAHADWKKRGITIAQKPTRMDFGHTFVALDPDGHRLRVFAPAEPAAP